MNKLNAAYVDRIPKREPKRFPYSERTNVLGFQLHVIENVNTSSRTFEVWLNRQDTSDYSGVLLATGKTRVDAMGVARDTLFSLYSNAR